MDATQPHNLERYRFEPTAIALAYRWATLVVGLLIALLAESRPGSERMVLLAPIALAALVSVVAIRSTSPRWLIAALVAEVGVAAVAIWITGHYDSPLLLYLTAPVVHAAVIGHARLVAALDVLAVGLFVGVVAVDPDLFAFRPGATIRDVSLLVLLPLLVVAVAAAANRRGRTAPMLEILDEDVAIAAELAAGKTYKEIGEALNMSPETVKVAVARLYRRLGARNREEAVNLIRDFALVRTPE